MKNILNDPTFKKLLKGAISEEKREMKKLKESDKKNQRRSV